MVSEEMSQTIPSRARIVIIGGGIGGCSIAYHLTKLGWDDVLLLERKKLTCGTTWHAAGLVGQLRQTLNMTRLAQYSAELYSTLESETGLATGFRQSGSLNIATTDGRMEEFKRAASVARTFGVEVEVVGPASIAELWPNLRVDDLVGGVFLPKDGQTDPINTALALAKGARNRGARIFEDTSVTGIRVEGGEVIGVVTDRGEIRCDYVVNCAGMWARDVGKMAGINVPLHACEHFYIVTEAMEGLRRDLPVLRDLDGSAYYKEDAGKLLIGAFELDAKPWGMDGIPEDFCFSELPEDFEHFQPILEKALIRFPPLRAVGIRKFFNGPESFTPDTRHLLGESTEVRNLFVAAGFNSTGIGGGGGIGKIVAEWIVNGHPPRDMWDTDIRRIMPCQNNKSYLRERVAEALGGIYDLHWPYQQYETARGVRTSPLHDRLKERGACFGEVAAWERPNWYAPPGIDAKYRYSYKRQNWFDYSAEECRAVRQAVGLLDLSSMAKFLVQGEDAQRALQKICTNDVGGPAGKVVYTQWLNERGGIEADLTVTRLARDKYMIVTSAASQQRDLHWLVRHLPHDLRVTATDVSSGIATIGLAGPNSRALLAAVSDTDFSNASFPFGAAREIDLGLAKVLAQRLSYTGELGWELHMPTEFARCVFDVLEKEGRRYGLRLVGMHALDSLRIEKAFRHWGHDITDEDTPVEAGLAFACKFSKSVAFIGKEAVSRQLTRGVRKRLVQFALKETQPLLYGNEPIIMDGIVVGRLTSGAYGHTLGRAVGLGYVHHVEAQSDAIILTSRFDLEVACERFEAVASLRPLYDPDNARLRA